MKIDKSDVRRYLPQFLDHYNKLSSTDRYCRFLNTMSPDAIRSWLMQTVDTPDSNYFFVIPDEDDWFVAVAQLFIDKYSSRGIIAISVLEEYRGKGYGKQLIKEIIVEAKKLYLSFLTFECSYSNHASRKLFESVGFTIKYNSEMQMYTGALNLNRCNYDYQC